MQAANLIAAIMKAAPKRGAARAVFLSAAAAGLAGALGEIDQGAARIADKTKQRQPAGRRPGRKSKGATWHK